MALVHSCGDDTRGRQTRPVLAPLNVPLAGPGTRPVPPVFLVHCYLYDEAVHSGLLVGGKDCCGLIADSPQGGGEGEGVQSVLQLVELLGEAALFS